MKRFVLCLAVLSALHTPAIFAQSARGTGIGIVLGDPTGISAKFWLNRVNAVDVMAGFGSENVHADYLWHKFGLFRVRRGRLPLYYGIGGALHFKEPQIGVRVPVGLTYLFPNDPIDIFFEIAPVIYPVTEADLDLTAGIGVRFFFH